MDKTLTLPPLVRGNVTGFLDFFVDEIRIFRKLLFLSDSFDIVAQVQWWGEFAPAYIRPPRLEVPQARSKREKLLKAYLHSARYVVKTKVDLLKSYLKACEVVEVSVLEATENYVIGSAFLKDFVNLLNNDEFAAPVFNYVGDEIGEVKIHVNFSQNEKKDPPGNLVKRTRFTPSYTDRISRSSQLPNKTNSFSLPSSPKELSPTKEFCKCLPEIETLGDSSKVLYFDLGLRHNDTGRKYVEKINKFHTNSVKCKSRVKTREKVKHPDCKQNAGNMGEVLKLPQTRESGLQQVPSKEISQVKILDYLLGSDMSKEDEESAVSDFKKMSPSHDLVTSINQLCLSSESLKPVKKQIGSLQFDLDNPIERDYYERFYVKSSSRDFEVVELLNEQGSSSLLRRRKYVDESRTKADGAKLQNESRRKENNFTNGLKEEIGNSCPRCKYYKKLDELDAIIESLKHFEERILLQEEDAEVYSRRLAERSGL